MVQIWSKFGANLTTGALNQVVHYSSQHYIVKGLFLFNQHSSVYNTHAEQIISKLLFELD